VGNGRGCGACLSRQPEPSALDRTVTGYAVGRTVVGHIIVGHAVARRTVVGSSRTEEDEPV